MHLVHEVRSLATAEGVPDTDVSRLVGEFRARGRALVRGELTPIRHIKGPMRTVRDIDVYELRAGVEYGEGLQIQVRAYHVEPSSLARQPGSTVVGLHVHVKDLSDPATVDVKQDIELQIARDRFHTGRTTRWGGATVVRPFSHLV